MVRRHLERTGGARGVAEGAVAELERLDYLDDARFAQRFAEDRRRLDAWGADRIERRLLALGVPSDLAAGAAAAGEGHDELDAAVTLLRTRIRQPPDSDRERDRALGLLARRGYELELAYDAVRAFERDG